MDDSERMKLLQDIADLGAEIAARDARIKELEDEKTRDEEYLRGILRDVDAKSGGLAVCSWCALPTLSDEAMKRQHQQTCEKNPMRAELHAARAEVSRLTGALREIVGIGYDGWNTHYGRSVRDISRAALSPDPAAGPAPGFTVCADCGQHYPADKTTPHRTLQGEWCSTPSTTAACDYCGKHHSPLESLGPECLAAVPVVTSEQIDAALEQGRRDLAAFRGEPYPAAPAPETETVHRCPPDESNIMPCCGRTPFEVLQDRMTLDDRLVTCAPRTTPAPASATAAGEDLTKCASCDKGPAVLCRFCAKEMRTELERERDAARARLAEVEAELSASRNEAQCEAEDNAKLRERLRLALHELETTRSIDAACMHLRASRGDDGEGSK